MAVMAARVIEFRDVRNGLSGPPGAAEAPACPSQPLARERFHFWIGASGQSYVHTIYSLIDCPAIPACNYLLVRRDAGGKCHALSAGRVADDAPSLNLAHLRHLGASLGANEVHIHLLAGTPKQSKLVEFDLKASLFECLAADPVALRH